MALLANWTRLVIAAAALLAAAAAHAEQVLIVHPSCPATRLDADDARRLLLGEELSWSNGEAAQLIELRGEDPAANAGYLAIARKTPSQIRAEWNRLVFSGRANPPLRFGTPAEVRDAVARFPGAFAVVDSSLADSTVRVVFRVSGKR